MEDKIVNVEDLSRVVKACNEVGYLPTPALPRLHGLDAPKKNC